MANSSKLDMLRNYAVAQGWNIEPGKPIPYGEQIVVIDGTLKVPVNYYPKSTSLVFGGSVSPLKDALHLWARGLDSAQSSSHEADMQGIAETTDHRPIQAGSEGLPSGSPVSASPHIGMDEAGKGDWFGPLVVAAVFLDEEQSKAMREMGVRDSKSLRPESIERLATAIKQAIPVHQYHVLILSPETYNQEYERHKNINLLLAEVYAQAAQEVWRATHSSRIVCDQFSQRADRLESTFAARHLPPPIQQHHAENASTAVAAASILASAVFAEAMRQLGERAGIGQQLPRGASDLKNLTAAVRHIIQTEGTASLGQYAKLKFAPIQELLTGGVSSPRDSASKSVPLATDESTADALEITQPAWHLSYHKSGFWRFDFTDGGILDWYAYSTGKMDVRGKQSALSYTLLKEKARSTYGPAVDDADAREKLAVLKQRVERYFPEQQVRIARVPGIGWHHRQVLWGERFDFTDGGILWYYPSTASLSIQGKASAPVALALQGLLKFSWSRLDTLIDALKTLFPDWELGSASTESGEPTVGELDRDSWVALENAMDWRSLWPEGRQMRLAANQRSCCQEEFLNDWSSVLEQHQGKKHLLAMPLQGLGKRSLHLYQQSRG